MKLGISGSRAGMNNLQINNLFELLHEDKRFLDITELHHGDCIGVDAEMHDLAVSWIPCKVIIHPPIQSRNRAFKHSLNILPEKEYKPRNIDIVKASDFLIAIPNSVVQRGGTWHAIGIAKWLKKPHLIILPNGEVIDSCSTAT